LEGGAYDLHVHSVFSGDSLLRPETIVKVAMKRGLEGIAVTDHETVEGGLRARRLAAKGLSIIVGYETRIQKRDIICLFVEEITRASDMEELHERTKEKGGITILAHPYRMFAPTIGIEKVEVDAIEVFNSRLSLVRNRKGEELARRLNKPRVAGSDAHVASEIGRAYTVLDGNCEPREAILLGLTRPFGSPSPLWVRPASLLSRTVAVTSRIFGREWP